MIPTTIVAKSLSSSDNKGFKKSSLSSKKAPYYYNTRNSRSFQNIFENPECPPPPPEKECPPCFNCLLPAFSCLNFANCSAFDAKCQCPPGFGGDDCSLPVCNSLSEGPNRHIRPDNQTCECSEGWEGINCNVCKTDSSCDPMVATGTGGVCYKGGLTVKENFQMCDVTNRKILDMLPDQPPQVTFSCNRPDETFWINQTESFYCHLSECSFDKEITNNLNITKYTCENIKCKCMEGEMLCGKGGNLSEWLVEEIKGPGTFICKNPDDCRFSEPAMNGLIMAIFGDENIFLNCYSGECLHYSEVPGFERPPKPDNTNMIIVSILAVLTFVAGIFAATFYLSHNWKTTSSYGQIQLTDNNESAKLMTDHIPASLLFQDVSYWVGDKKQVLNSIHGVVKPGELMAIMGGSGAGKTTFLDILARKNKAGTISGEIYVNGRIVGDDEFKRVVGYVDQEDHLLSTLTVYETILYSALLRLPREMSFIAKRLRVIDTMRELGILGIKDSRIGDAGARSISGGEKRRVSIACELVTSPSILFLDEPTSGLDAYNACNVIECLVTLAKNYNRTVICTIHQPRSNIFALFDQLVLLANGYMVYSGPANKCQSHFENIGHSCPPGFNIADFLEHNNREIDIDMNNDGFDDDTSEHLRNLVSSYRRSLISLEIKDEIDRAVNNTHQRASWLTQFRILSDRTFKNLYRNPMLMLTHYCISVYLALLCGALFYKVTNDIAGFQNRMGVLFFMCALFGFGCLSSLHVFAAERIIFVKERANGYYSPITYFSSKVLVPPILMGVIIYHMVGLVNGVPEFFKFLLVLILFNLTAASICLCIGILFKEVSVASLLSSLIMLFSMLFDYLAWLKDLSFFNYAFEAMIVNEVVYLQLTEEKYGLKIDVPGATILSTFGFDASAYWSDVFKLTMMFSIFIILSFTSLQLLVKERR
ncbi:5641_t:CDS:10 [Diversispora eburnea]|uniref:5641_t:CDS:1 n=1 Tax=Diversispora eburnea TaxID=1213867 RepID=A0A9N8W5J3_9GLOM|nr:5641_t:CDS:10 [Diversispora eburnea]